MSARTRSRPPTVLQCQHSVAVSGQGCKFTYIPDNPSVAVQQSELDLTVLPAAFIVYPEAVLGIHTDDIAGYPCLIHRRWQLWSELPDVVYQKSDEVLAILYTLS